MHRAYIEAGAECIATCSYQVSRMGYAEVGLPPERADAALLRSVELARSAVAEFPDRRVLVAGSLGPYGAALHNGGEYHGNYDCSFDDLVRFHRERIEVFARAKGRQAPDLLAFETFPSLEEARAVGEALAPWPELQAWFSFSCRDEKHVSHGERVADCAALVASFPQTVAIGVNCVPPKWIPSLIAESARRLRQADAGLSELGRRMGRGAALLDGRSPIRRTSARERRSGSKPERRLWAAAAARGRRIFALWRRRLTLSQPDFARPARVPLVPLRGGTKWSARKAMESFSRLRSLRIWPRAWSAQGPRLSSLM